MTYYTILQTLKNWVEASSINGRNVYCEVCLEDEIELNPKTTYPCVFICPIPFEMASTTLNKYSFRVYVATSTTVAPDYPSISGSTLSNRITTFNTVIVYAENMVKALPDDWLEVYPLTITPVLLWDNTYDGIYFDLVIHNFIDCAEITLTGTTGNQYLITNGTSGTSGISPSGYTGATLIGPSTYTYIDGVLKSIT